jgi:hypothetical protein
MLLVLLFTLGFNPIPMKNLIKTALILLTFFLYDCSSKTEEVKGEEVTEAKDTSPTSTVESESPTLPAVCIWKEVSVKEVAEEKGKYKTTIYLGEQVSALADTASEKTGTRTIKFRKVRLTDGTEGWVREDFIALNSSPAACIKETTLYRRPDFMTPSGKNFKMMDVVAVKSKVGEEWSEVIGKRAGDTWFSSGWVKTENLAQSAVDVAFAVFYLKAQDIPDEIKREEEIQKILQNPDFSTSIFQVEFENEEAPTDKTQADQAEESDQ